MRYILLILIFFVSIDTYSQNPYPFVNRSQPSVIARDGRVTFSTNLYIPNLPDTTLMGGPDSLGAILYVKKSASFYYRDTNLISGGHQWTKIATGSSGSVNAKRSIIKLLPDTVQLVNDSALNTATGRKFGYQIDTTGRRAYYEDKYVSAKNFKEIRGLRLPDTSYIFRANSSQVVGDYVYDPTDVTTTDDTVVTIVSGTYRYKRYIPDGVYDPHWWGAKANGTYDDTWAVQQAINAANKYTGNNGTVIRLTGNYKFDPSNFVYNTGRGMVFEITGNVQLLNTWRITRGVSIIGRGGATAEASFAWSNIASIQYTVTNTGAPKAAVELTYGGNTLRNLTIGSYGGIGVKLNGTFFIPAALALLDNVSASVGSYTGKQTGLLVSDWFWFKLDNCSFSVDGTSSAGSSSIKLEGKTYFPDINLCYLGEFNNCTAQGRPIRIQAGDTADASLNVGIVNITFRNLTIENVAPDTAAIMLNSTRIPIDNIVFERPVMVDTYNMGFFIYNAGNNTTGVKLHDGDLLSGQLKKIFGGAAIVNKYFTSTAKPINNFVFNPNSRQLYDDFGINGSTDNINMNRGWKPPLELQLYDGGQIARNAARLKDSVITSASVVTEPFTGYNGDTVAIKVTPDGTNSNPTIQIKQYEQVWHTGDQIYFGAWVKSDYMDSIFSTALKAQIDGGYLWQGVSGATITSDITYISQPNNGWRFLICSGLIDASASDHSSHKMYLYINSNDTNRTHPFYVSHAFAYKIDSATAINQNEFLSWVKMNAGGLYAVPSKSYGIRDDLAFYIGDSTRFLKGVLQRMDGTGTWQSVGGGGGSITLAPIGSSPNANGASFSSGTLTLQPANGSFGGVLTTGSQTIAGSKTFSNELFVTGPTPNNPTALIGNLNLQTFNNTNAFVANNSYYDNSAGGYKYLQNGEAAQFHFVSGDIRFEGAPSGTAGGTATMNEIMRVTNAGEVWTNGSVSIGSLSSPTWPLDVNGVIRTKGGTASFLMNDRGSNNSSILLYSPSASDFIVYDFVNNTNRLEIANTGQLTLSTYTSGNFNANDTTNYKPLVVNSSGTVYRMQGWPTTGSSVTTLYSGDGTLSGNRQVSGAGNNLSLGTGGSKVALFTINSSSRSIFNSAIVYGTDATNTDANYTVPSNVIIAELTDVPLTTGRTLTLPTAVTNGQCVTLVMRFSAGSNKYSLSAAVTDNATGSTFTTLDWGKTYDFYVDQSLSWRLIRKY